MIQKGMYTFCLRNVCNVMEMFEDFPGTQMTLVLILNDRPRDFSGSSPEKKDKLGSMYGILTYIHLLVFYGIR